MSYLLIITLAIASTSCFTPRTRSSADGKGVPARPFLEFSSWDYHCDALTETDPVNLEEYLQSFGDEGWEVATTIIRDGRTIGICFQR